jgi:hypothetical protein
VMRTVEIKADLESMERSHPERRGIRPSQSDTLLLIQR